MRVYLGFTGRSIPSNYTPCELGQIPPWTRNGRSADGGGRRRAQAVTPVTALGKRCRLPFRYRGIGNRTELRCVEWTLKSNAKTGTACRAPSKGLGAAPAVLLRFLLVNPALAGWAKV